MTIEDPSVGPADIWRLAQLIIAALILAIVSYFLGRRHIVAGIAFVILPILITGGLLQELHDPATGVGIQVAHGVTYFRLNYTAAVSISVLSLIATIFGVRAARRVPEA